MEVLRRSWKDFLAHGAFFMCLGVIGVGVLHTVQLSAHYLEIFGSIVFFISVNVVDYLFACQSSLQNIFHYPTLFCGSARAFFYSPVALVIGALPTLPLHSFTGIGMALPAPKVLKAIAFHVMLTEAFRQTTFSHGGIYAN